MWQGYAVKMIGIDVFILQAIVLLLCCLYKSEELATNFVCTNTCILVAQYASLICHSRMHRSGHNAIHPKR